MKKPAKKPAKPVAPQLPPKPFCLSIAEVELFELQLQWNRYCPDTPVNVRTDPMRYAEEIDAILMARVAGGLSVRMPNCHSCAPLAEGWVPDDPTCMRCVRRLECICAIHRVGKLRPQLRIQERVIEPLTLEEAHKRLPVTPVMVIRRATPADWQAHPIDHLRTMARIVGLDVAENAGKNDIIAALRDALPMVNSIEENVIEEPAAAASAEPEPTPLLKVADLIEGTKLTCRLENVPAAARVTLVAGNPIFVMKKTRYPDVAKLTEAAVRLSGNKAKRRAFAACWLAWGIEPPKRSTR